jgi:hypothetical protein
VFVPKRTREQSTVAPARFAFSDKTPIKETARADRLRPLPLRQSTCQACRSRHQNAVKVVHLTSTSAGFETMLATSIRSKVR